MSAPYLTNFRQQFNQMLFNTNAAYYFEPLVERFFPNVSLVNNKALVVNIIKEKEDVLSIVLKPKTKWKGFIAGQFIEIGVKINAVYYTRIFSISSTQQQFKKDKTITISVQRQQNGKVTNWIFDTLAIGSSITISDAMGEFILSENNKKALFIAGGTGITPFKSMLQKSIDKNNDVVLLYYAKTNQHIFKNELEQFSTHKNIKIHCIETNSNGRISLTHLHDYCADFSDRKIFICGPNSMIADTQQLLVEKNIKEEQIISEYFKAVEFKTTINLDDNISTLKLNKRSIEVIGKATILEQLEANGLQPKHGCRMGLCKQCTCTKNKGIVFNKLTNKFSEATTESIQICVSVPIGEVEINL